MKQRAFSQLEVLLSLALLATLAAAAVSWTTGAVRVRAAAAEASRQADAVRAFERTLRTDLIGAACVPPEEAAREPRLVVAGRYLRLVTRDRGPVQVVYRLDGDELKRSAHPFGTPAGRPERVLIDDVADARFGLVLEPDQTMARLVAELQTSHGKFKFVADVRAEWAE